MTETEVDIQEALLDLENGEMYIPGQALDPRDRPAFQAALDGESRAVYHLCQEVLLGQ